MDQDLQNKHQSQPAAPQTFSDRLGGLRSRLEFFTSSPPGMQGLRKVIRNRRGHRPLSANRHGGDVLVASYNVHKCVGTDKVFNPHRILHVISEIKADILALQEIDKRFGCRSGLLDLAALKERCGLHPVPINAMSPGGHGFHGNALFFRNGVVRDVHQMDLPGVEPRGALIVDFHLASGPLRVVAAHFGLLRRSRERQVAAIMERLERCPAMPTIMVGDFNEWRLGKNSSLKSLMHSFDVTMGSVPSFPSRFPIFALDRVLAAPHHLVTSVDIHHTPLAQTASDHLPVKAWIDLKNAQPKSALPLRRVG